MVIPSMVGRLGLGIHVYILGRSLKVRVTISNGFHQNDESFAHRLNGLPHFRYGKTKDLHLMNEQRRYSKMGSPLQRRRSK